MDEFQSVLHDVVGKMAASEERRASHDFIVRTKLRHNDIIRYTKYGHTIFAIVNYYKSHYTDENNSDGYNGALEIHTYATLKVKNDFSVSIYDNNPIDISFLGFTLDGISIVNEKRGDKSMAMRDRLKKCVRRWKSENKNKPIV